MTGIQPLQRSEHLSNYNSNDPRHVLTHEQLAKAQARQANVLSPVNLDNRLKNVRSTSNEKSERIRRMLRNIDRKKQDGPKTFTGTVEEKMSDYLALKQAEAKEKKEKAKAKPFNYSYKEVANKIRQAKTAVSAGKALLAAKRKVLEVKRKLASGNGDPEKLQAALIHAQRMEMTARKKKHHMELEELIKVTGERDERMEKQEDAFKEARNAMIFAAEEKVSGAEDEIFKQREELVEEVAEMFGDDFNGVSEHAMDMLKDLNELIAKYGEEELKKLEETMEALENMEILDPHMSKEDLEELKKKHRASEEKAIIKAEMAYLKSLVKAGPDKVPGIDMSKGFEGLSFSPSVSFTGAFDAPDASLGAVIDVSV